MSECSPSLYRAGSGEPVVLLHGFTGTWAHWRPVLAELVARYEVIAPTLAGHAGGPDYPEAQAGVSIPAAADHLEQHLADIGVGTAHFVGNSMGGALSLELAKRGLARSVVAFAPGGGWTQGDGEAQRVGRFFARQTKVIAATAPRAGAVMRRAGSRRLALRDIMRFGDRVSPYDATDLVHTSNRCAVVPQVIDALLNDRGVALTDLDQIACPTLIAASEFDRILPKERHTPRLLKEIPGVQSRVLAGVGHVPMWDATRLVERTIIDWVDQHTDAVVPTEPVAAPA